MPAGAKKNENKHQKTYYDDDDDERLRSGGCGRAHAPPENTFTRANYRKEKRERKRRFLKEKERESELVGCAPLLNPVKSLSTVKRILFLSPLRERERRVIPG